MAIRVSELAKELKVTSKELVEKLRALKINVKGHASTLDKKTVTLVKKELKPKKSSVKKKEPVKVKAKAKAKVKAEPKKRPEKKRAKRVPSEVEGKEPAKKVVREEKPEVEARPEPVVEEKVIEKKPDLKVLKIDLPVTLKELALKLQTKPSELIKKLLTQKILVTINQSLNEENAGKIAQEFGYTIERLPTQEETLLAEHEKEDPKNLKPRAPIVTFMGHVDHGKTSLLDMIRKTKVVDKEAGGITQHIGAYEVVLPKGRVTFLDTPGHAAFTAMRARGANATDVVVLVVAADDGIMPQTIEAIDHARAANVPIIVAINKIDKQNINLDKVKKQLAERELMPEDWGGKTITVSVSAKTGQGIDDLLDMLLLEAEMLELKANPDRPASGVVVEAELSKGKGPVATILVAIGTLKLGDMIIVGLNYGKVKAMLDDKGRRVSEAGPAKPVEILGLSGVPLAGERFYVIGDEKKARDIVSVKRMEAEKKKLDARSQKITLEELYDKIKEGEVKELKIILKADVQGSLEAIKDSLEKLSTAEVKLSVIHGQVGNINESDVMLASASNAVMLGFHVAITPEAKALSKQEGVDVRLYNIIYEAINDVKAAMEGLLEPVIEETFLGRAEVRQVFKVSKVGIVAGCYISKGTIPRNAIAKLIRDKEVIFKAKISSLRHLKDDVKEVKEGYECGISLSFKDIKKGDLIEAIEIHKVARRLK
ncbi:MAG: translation initiation factor IF-2 [Candidatus Omnitrophica bacterium]|nr:translation initiation factor IF-2 [Candidatus Omnitrophota bacterium]MBU4590739.1 translation initiation factor IF-2 [Candidatus Omnitrophota bacterium]